MTDCGGRRGEGLYRNRRNARDPENGIEQCAILRAETVNFIALVRKFRFESVCLGRFSSVRVEKRGDAVPEFADCGHGLPLLRGRGVDG
jgi:hypothetical protein